ncbi:MAG: hypothetical protein L0229_09835 [Blastocatellia bacterium]|nr:hypothetical protein [Blastocatellia bacterium]
MSKTILCALIIFSFFALAPYRAEAQAFEFFPGGTYDSSVPTPEAVLGYPIGSYHTDYAGLERWLNAIKSSNRVKILRYGESVERRPLYLIIVSSPANLAHLDTVQSAMNRLADPRTTTDTDAERLATTMPAVAWMNYANDGNESAAFEAAIQTSYQLAAGTDEVTRSIVDRLVTIINPAHNPESHERFVAWYNSAQVSPDGTADPAAAEHHAPWGMSTNNNHYQIDLNRDAFFVTQPETSALVLAFGEWNPVVFVDHHGQTKNMFFPPPAEAINLNVTANQVDWMSRYGNAIGAALDCQGASYYRRGRFDLFYAGFWDSWPTLNGSVGMTFETDGGGSKGMAFEREDKTILTLRDGILHHFTGTMATLKLTAEDKDRRLRDFYQYKKSAIEEGAREAMKQIILVPGKDEARARMLVETLRAQRIEVHRTSAPIKLARAHNYMGAPPGAREIPAGSYIISMAQPQKRLARAILEPEPAFKEDFLKNEERKKKRAELMGERWRDGFYDTTAWSLPILYGIEAYWSEDAPPATGLTRVDAMPAPSVNSSVARATYGYAFSPESFGSMRLLAQLLKENFNTAIATEPFRVGGRDFPRGSVIARVERNPASLHDRISALATETGVTVYALNSARVESGPDLGEDPIVELRAPRIAVITDEPTDDRAYGATWFTLERRLGLGFTAIKIEQLKSSQLTRYDCIIFPHGSPADYQDMLGEGGIARLRRWAEDGGTLVLVKGAAAFATRKGVEWTSATLKRHQATVRLFFEESEEDGNAPSSNASDNSQSSGKDNQADKAKENESKPVTRDMELPRTSGALLRVKIDPEHFLGFGYADDIGATVSSNYAFTISRQGKNVAAYPGEDELRLAGFMWPETRKAMAKTLYLWQERIGRGQAILFADDPNFRATQLSTMRLFFNAAIIGPSFAAWR